MRTPVCASAFTLAPLCFVIASAVVVVLPLHAQARAKQKPIETTKPIDKPSPTITSSPPSPPAGPIPIPYPNTANKKTAK
jgi:hypothetical protein